MRLIDADALCEALGIGKECTDCQYAVGAAFCHKSSDFVDVCEAIADAPTVEPQRMNGRWIKISPAGIYECSICGKNVMTSDIDAYDFCHGCGNPMEVIKNGNERTS